MPTTLALWCIAGLFAVTVLAVALGRSSSGTRTVYGLSFVLSSAAAISAATALVGAPGAVSTVVLPLGLPWLGAHFRVDALAVISMGRFLILCRHRLPRGPVCRENFPCCFRSPGFL